MPTTFKSRGPAASGPRGQVGELPLGVVQVHVERHRIAIDQQRHGPLVADHFGRGGEGHGGHQHGLAGLQPQGLDRQVQCGRAGIDGHGLRGPDGARQNRPRTASSAAPSSANRNADMPPPRRFRLPKFEDGKKVLPICAVASSAMTVSLSVSSSRCHESIIITPPSSNKPTCPFPNRFLAGPGIRSQTSSHAVMPRMNQIEQKSAAEVLPGPDVSFPATRAGRIPRRDPPPGSGWRLRRGSGATPGR